MRSAEVGRHSRVPGNQDGALVRLVDRSWGCNSPQCSSSASGMVFSRIRLRFVSLHSAVDPDLVCIALSLDSPCRRPHALVLLVLGLQLLLQVEVELALAFDALLLHITDHALVHRLFAVDFSSQQRP